MLCSIIGLPGSGKSSLFKLLTHKGSSARSGKGLDIAIVKVPDERLEKVAGVFNPQSIIPAEIEFADTAVKSTKRDITFGEIQGANCLVYCIRAFDGGFGEPEPGKDVADLIRKLTQFDINILEHRIENIDISLRAAKREERQTLEQEKRSAGELKDFLEDGGFLGDMEFSPGQEKMVTNFALLTAKPALIVLNCDEKRHAQRLQLDEEIRRKYTGIPTIAIMTKMELELEELTPEEATPFREELGLTEPAVDKFIKAAYEAMGVITFFTGCDKEVRARTILEGTNAHDAAEKIHTDMARGFIRAEVVGWRELIEAGSWSSARSQGILRQEGKDYIIEDGDVVFIKFAI